MDKINAKHYLPLVKALAEGKTIQKKGTDGIWHTMNQFTFECDHTLYRIKPEAEVEAGSMYSYYTAHGETETVVLIKAGRDLFLLVYVDDNEYNFNLKSTIPITSRQFLSDYEDWDFVGKIQSFSIDKPKKTRKL